MASKNRISARQDWDCEAALEQKADEIRDRIDELEEELRVVLAHCNREDAQDPTVSHLCIDCITISIVIAGVLGLLVLAIIHAGS